MRGLLETRDETEKQLRLWRSNLLLAESNRATRRAAKMLRPQHEAMIECFEYLRRLNDVM